MIHSLVNHVPTIRVHTDLSQHIRQSTQWSSPENSPYMLCNTLDTAISWMLVRANAWITVGKIPWIEPSDEKRYETPTVQKGCKPYLTIRKAHTNLPYICDNSWVAPLPETEGEGFEPPGQLTQLFSRQPQ